MQEVCTNCHNPNYVKNFYTQYDAGVDLYNTKFAKPAQLIMNSGVDYEFRTTMMPLLKVADIESIAKRISGAKRYALQQYRISKPKGDIKHVSMQLKPLGSAEIKKAAKAAERYLDNVIVRGI